MIVEKLLHALPATVWVKDLQFDLELRIDPGLPCIELGYFLVDSLFSRKLNEQALPVDQAQLARDGWFNTYLGISCDYLFCVRQIENDSELKAAITELRRELTHKQLMPVDC